MMADQLNEPINRDLAFPTPITIPDDTFPASEANSGRLTEAEQAENLRAN